MNSDIDPNTAPTVSGLVASELESLDADLSQIRSIVADAVSKLGGGFEQIASQSKAQQELLMGLLCQVNAAGQHRGIVSLYIAQSEQLIGRVSNGLEAASQRTLGLAAKLEAIDAMFRTLTRLSESILDVSEQIRVLAFNARLEATRAGHAGRGFDVVASAVGHLSRDFRTLTAEVRDTVAEARHSISETVLDAKAAAEADHSMVSTTRNEMVKLNASTQTLNRDMAESLEHAREMGSKIHTGVSQCVRGLQFDDLVGQICQSSRRRLAACKAVSDAADSLMVECTREDHNRLRECVAELSDGQHRAVQQTSLEAGDVEFF